MDIYLAFKESYLPTYGNTHTHTQKGDQKKYIINNSRHLLIPTYLMFVLSKKRKKEKGKEREKEGM